MYCDLFSLVKCTFQRKPANLLSGLCVFSLETKMFDDFGLVFFVFLFLFFFEREAFVRVFSYMRVSLLDTSPGSSRVWIDDAISPNGIDQTKRIVRY